MDAGSIENLELKRGEVVTAAHVNQLDRAIVRNNSLPGLRVRRRQYPWGVSYSAYGVPGVGSSPIFQPDVTITRTGAEVRWDGPRALIGGVTPQMPSVAGLPPKFTDPQIFTEDEKTGQRPALIVPLEAFSKETGECRVYFKVTVGSDFRALSAHPVALPGQPVVEAKAAHKLALFLRIRDGSPSYIEELDREMFCGQGFMAVGQKPSGKFEALWWASF